MNPIKEIKRQTSSANLPQALTWDGAHFWMGSLDTQSIYQLNPATWQVLCETKTPGYPFSLVSVANELRVLTGETSEDDRYIRRLVPGQGFDPDFKVALPELTGSQLSYDGTSIYVSQWYNQQVLRLDEEGNITRTLSVPHGISGQVILGDVLYLITTDDEENGDYWLTRLNLKDENPVPEDIALVPFPARSLTHDGTHFWTHHRAAGEAVCFELT